LTEKLEANFRNLTLPKMVLATKANFDRSHKVNFGNLTQPKTKLAKEN